MADTSTTGGVEARLAMVKAPAVAAKPKTKVQAKKKAKGA